MEILKLILNQSQDKRKLLYLMDTPWKVYAPNGGGSDSDRQILERWNKARGNIGKIDRDTNGKYRLTNKYGTFFSDGSGYATGASGKSTEYIENLLDKNGSFIDKKYLKSFLNTTDRASGGASGGASDRVSSKTKGNRNQNNTSTQNTPALPRWTPDNYERSYFGNTSQFNTNRDNLDDNSYTVNGIQKGFDGRSSIGILSNWNKRRDGSRGNLALQQINLKFGQNFTDVTAALNYVNQMLKNSSIITGADMGSISTDGKWGDQSQRALDLVSSIYEKNGNTWNKIDQNNSYADKARTINPNPNIPIPKPQLTPTRARLSMFTDDDIRNLGFKNYAGMVSAIGNQSNANNNFVKAMIDRYGANTSNWDQNTIENDLGVRGTYRSFGGGDFGDMSRAMAGWVGKNNGEIDKQELLNRTGSDGTIYSNSRVRDLFDKVQLRPKQYTFNITPIGSTTPKMQLGGSINMNEQQLQQAFLLYLAQQTGAKSQQELEQVIQQMGEDGLKQAYAQFVQAMQLQQVQAAKFGAKLNYIKQLNGQCPQGMEMHYYKEGGRLCKKCMQAKQNGGELETPSNPIDAFKCGRKIKKNQLGKKLPQIKSKDLATMDSIAANRYNDQEVLINRPGSYKKNAKGKVQWTPDRTKAPYKRG